MKYKLITITPSHYCEKVRWVLEYLNIDYEEEPHPPLFHLKATKKINGRSCPILITPEKTLMDSTDILKYLDEKYDEIELYPKDPEKRKLVEELEDLYDNNLGPHVRRWAYYYLLNHPKLVKSKFCVGQNKTEEKLFSLFFPIISFLMKKSMNINEKGYLRSKKKIQEVFDKTEELLENNNEFLVTDSISAADVTLAALGAPLISHEKYMRQKYFSNETKDLPQKMLGETKEYRLTKVGKYINELYNSYR